MTGQRGLPQDHGHDVAHRDTDRPRLCRRFGWRWLRRAEYVALPCKFIRRYLLYDRGRWFLAKFKVGDGGVDFGLLLLLPVSDNLGLTRVVFLLCALPLRTFFFRSRQQGTDHGLSHSANNSPVSGSTARRGLPDFPGTARRPNAVDTCAANAAFPSA